MKEVAEDDGGDSSDISGYHSDSDSAIMMSGNSPYVTKRARHNFLTRSGKHQKVKNGLKNYYYFLLMGTRVGFCLPTIWLS